MKGTGTVIVEDLTPLNLACRHAAFKHPKVTNTWTKEGVLHAMLHNGKVVKLRGGNQAAIDEAAQDQATVPDIDVSAVTGSQDNGRCKLGRVHPTAHSSSTPIRPRRRSEDRQRSDVYKQSASAAGPGRMLSGDGCDSSAKSTTATGNTKDSTMTDRASTGVEENTTEPQACRPTSLDTKMTA